MIKCPTCGSMDCIRPAGEVLDSMYQIYLACPGCPPEPGWDKKVQLSALLDDNESLQCPSCGRRPLDAVMRQVLSIMLEHGDREATAGLARAGTPMIARGFPLMYPPRLGPGSLVLIADNIRSGTARDIMDHVPQIKGVVLRRGDPAESVGILDSDAEPHEYELLAGCDMRCDIARTAFGELVIYKTQSKIHIEFDNRHKMGKLEQLFQKGVLSGAVVVDGMCGPGTLGLMAMLLGARRVVFNDAWRPAVENLLLNLEVNHDILDVEPELVSPVHELPMVGGDPILAARAGRGQETVAEIYLGDIRRLGERVHHCDVCLVDAFPGLDPSDIVNQWEHGNVIVI